MSTCRSCGASIRWAKSAAGRSMPLDAEPDPAGNVAVNAAGVALVMGPLEAEAARAAGQTLWLSHFVSCPHAESHRKAAAS